MRQETPKKPRKSNRPGKPPGPVNPSWRFYAGYFLVMIVLLLLWQQILPLAVRTITYSDFKAALGKGEVKAVAVGRDEINGRIQRLAAPGQKGATNGLETFNFRAVRVEDPDLVKELDAAHVKYEGIRPGVISALLWAWVVPIGLMLLLWVFISRRLVAAAASV